MRAADGLTTAVMLSGLIALSLLALTPLTTLWDRDEPRFARAAVEMAESGNYVVPTFNGELRAQKPPMVYWLMTASLQLFGASEIAVRFWSPIGIAVAALATFFAGRRLWSPAIGLRAMVILALSPMTLIQGVAATTDALLLASVTTSVAVIIDALFRGPRILHALLLTLSIAAGLLIKGPVALVLPFGIAGAALWAARRELASGRGVAALLGVSAGAATAIYLAWLLPAASATGGEMVRRGLVYENLERFLRTFEGHGTPIALAPLYYPVVIVVGFLPWSLRLLPRLRRLRAQAFWTPRGALLAAWVAVPVAAFTLSATKLPHYVFPIWPALALLSAAGFPTEEDGRTIRSQFGRTALAAFVIAIVIVAGAATLDRFKPVPRVADIINTSAVAGPLYTYHFEEPSLAFYTGRRLTPLDGMSVARWAALPGAALLVAPRSALAEVERAHGPLPLIEIGSAHGWNIANGDQLELVAFVRRSGG